MFLHKRHSDGSVVWESSFVPTGVEAAYGIALTLHESGHIYVAGARLNSSTFKHEILVVKYNASGTVLWHTTIPGSGGDEFATAITVDGAQRIFVTGASQSVTDGWDMLTAGLSTSGQVIWTRRYDYAQKDDAPVSILRSGSSTVEVIGGSMDASGKWGVTSVKYLLNGTPGNVLRQDTLSIDFDRPFDFHLDPGGAYYLAGVTPEEAGYRFLTVNKFNTDLSKDWTYYHVEGTTATMGAVAVSPAGEVYVTGEIQMSEGASSKRLITLKLDTAGALAWQRRVKPGKSSAFSRGGAVSLSPAGHLLVAAEEGTPDTSRLRLRWYDAEGRVRAERRYEGSGHGRLWPVEAHWLGDTSLWISATALESGLGKYHTVKYELYDRELAFTLSQDSVPLYVSGDVIIRFAPGVVNTTWVDDGTQTWGRVGEILTDTSLISQMDQALGGGGQLDQWVLIRIFHELDSQPATATGRLGRTIDVPGLWAALVLEVGDATVKEPAAVSGTLDSIPHSLLRYAHPNYATRSPSPPLDPEPDDAFFDQQLSLWDADETDLIPPEANINVLPAWDLLTTQDWSNIQQLRVGLFDTGVNFLHEDFSDGVGNSVILSARSYVDGNAGEELGPDDALDLVEEDGGHGTRAAGVIAALRNNGKGIAGVAGGDVNSGVLGVGIHSYQAIESGEEGNVTNLSDLADAMLDALDLETGSPEIDIACLEVEIAVGQGVNFQDDIPVIREVVEMLYDLDIVSLTARGNGGQTIGDPLSSDKRYPASFFDHWLVSVGASGDDGARLVQGINGTSGDNFSTSFGDEMDLIAPGANELVFTTTDSPTNDSYGPFNGTSAALPHVTGVAALLIGAYEGQLAQEDVEKLLEYSADDIVNPISDPSYPTGYDDFNGWGRLNAGAALELIDESHGNLRVVHFEIENPDLEEFCLNCAVYPAWDYEEVCDGQDQTRATVVIVKKYYAELDIDLSALGFTPASFEDEGKTPFWTRSGGSELWGPLTQIDEQNYIIEPGNFIFFEEGAKIENGRLQGVIAGHQLSIFDTCNYAYRDPESEEPHFTIPDGPPRLRFSLLAEVPPGFDGEPIIITNTAEPSAVQSLKLSSYPNPVRDRCRIRYFLPQATLVNFQLWDINGRLIWTKQRTDQPMGHREEELDLSGLTPGIYWLRLRTEQALKTIKIVKQ